MSSLDSAGFDYIRRLVRERSGIALEDSKGYLVEQRLSPLAHKHGLPGLRELAARLRESPAGPLHEEVVDAMTTNETSFFRDVHPFEALRTQLLPEILRRRAARRTLHVWSAACSSGQEPYTLAMLLREHFPQLAGWSVRLYATDLSQEVLQRASAGRFSQLEVNRGLPATYLVKYFRREGAEWVLLPEVRQAVTFQRLNLLADWGVLPAMDLILMRNVLIYFTPETKRRLLEKVRRKLAADGALLLGGAETTLGLSDGFAREVLGKTTVFRPSAATAPAVPLAAASGAG